MAEKRVYVTLTMKSGKEHVVSVLEAEAVSLVKDQCALWDAAVGRGSTKITMASGRVLAFDRAAVESVEWERVE